MVRCIVSIIVSVAIIVLGGLFELKFIKTTFDELHIMLDEVHLKLQDKSATSDDIMAIQRFWLTKKSNLHAYIPHVEIKEIDLWIAECITYTKYEKYEDAEAKIEVVRELTEQIPQTFLLKIENLF